MTLDVVAKHGVIIGGVSMLATLMLFLSEISRIRFYVDPDESDYYRSTEYITRRLLYVALPLLGSISSALMIYGIVKKRHLMLTPWLAMGIILSLYITSSYLFSVMLWSHFYFDMFSNFIVVLGSQIIVLYPIGHLFLRIRRENIGAKTNYEHNILNACKNVSVSEKSAMPI